MRSPRSTHRTIATLVLVLLAGCNYDFLDGFDLRGGGGGGGGPGGPAAASFPDGVAAGEVTPTGAVLWTRALGTRKLSLQVSRDPGFPEEGTIRKKVKAARGRNLTAEVTVKNLEPGETWYYRFAGRRGGGVSPVGTFRTPPLETESARCRFGLVGDSDGTKVGSNPGWNDFDVLARAAAEGLDALIFLGDIVNVDSVLAPAPATTYDEIAAKWVENRTYAAFRDVLAASGVYAQPDDHDIGGDNYAGETVDPARFKAGVRAFLDHTPVRKWSEKLGFYRTFRWGREAELFILDERSFRSAPAAEGYEVDPFPTLPAEIREDAGLPPDAPAEVLAALADPKRTMLGKAQKRAFLERLRESDATWKLVVNEVAITEQFFLPYDRWEGYRAERKEILDFIAENDIRNVVFLTTDLHGNQVLDVRENTLLGTPVVATEVITGPVADATIYRELVEFLGSDAAALQTIGLFESLNPPRFSALDVCAYAVIDIDPAGTATVTVRDDAGTLLHEEVLTAR